MNFRIAALPALALLIPAPSIGSTDDTVEPCQVSDVYCFSRNHEKFCSDRSATVESCQGWIGYLDKRYATTRQSELRLRIAEAYEALTRLVSSSAEAERHRNHAVEIYRDILRRDDTNAQAMLGLAVVSQDRAERIELLKRGTELAPEEIYAMQLLASELLSTGEPEQALEAARVMEKAYASQTGRNKLHLASRTYELYLNAGATQEAAEFRQRVIDKLGTGNLKDLPSNVDPKTVLNALMVSCDHLIVPMLGSQRCMQDLEIVARQLASKDNLARARELASVTAMAMEDVAQAEELSVQYPEWTKTFLGWLATFKQRGFGTAEVYSAIARFASGDERFNALRRASELDPQNGQLAWRLGAEFAEREMWKEAVQELTRARSLVPPEQRTALDHQLDLARSKL